jgi:hypothetical protein
MDDITMAECEKESCGAQQRATELASQFAPGRTSRQLLVQCSTVLTG